MTPLELLAVGVIVGGTWFAGYYAGNTNRDCPSWAVLPLCVGVLQVCVAIVHLLILGIKEAAK